MPVSGMVEIARSQSMRAVAEIGVENATSTIIATRGARLALTRITGSNGVIGAGELQCRGA